MPPLRFVARHRLRAVAAAWVAGGVAAGQIASGPTAVAQDRPLPAEGGRPAAGEAGPPLLAAPEGDAATVRVIRGGRVVASGTPGPDGRLNAVPLPPGVYSVAGRVGGGAALFALRVTGDADAAPPPLAAPAADWPAARALLSRRFPELLPPETHEDAAAAPAAVPAAAAPAPRAVATVRRAVGRRTGRVLPGAVGRVARFDETGAATPVPGAEVVLFLDGEALATLRSDANGRFTLPDTLGPGVYSLLSVRRGVTLAESGVSLVGLRVAADDRAVSTPADAAFRPAAFVATAAVQEAGFSVAQAPASDLPAAFGPLVEEPPPGPPPPPPVPPGGSGGGAGGGSGGGAGGGLIPGLIGAGIGAGIAAAVADDDEGDAPAAANGGPGVASPTRPPFTPPGPPPSAGDADD